MGFIYFKPMSLEQVYSFLKNSNSGNSAGKGTNISIFNGFDYKEGMTLEEFEQNNYQRYQEYEMVASEAWAQKNLKSPDEKIREQAYKILKAYDDKLNDEIEQVIRRNLDEIKPDFGLNQNPSPKRLSYARARSLVEQIGDTIKDGGSKSCTISTPEGNIYIFLDNAITS